MAGKMTLKKGLVDRDVLHADHPFARLELEYAVDKQERISVRQHLHDVFDIHDPECLGRR